MNIETRNANPSIPCILTRQHNQYDQYGEYFVAWFADIPTDIRRVLEGDGYDADAALAAHILSGGGREGSEDVWWNLRRIPSCQSMRFAGKKLWIDV
jgi:hypothetical protein